MQEKMVYVPYEDFVKMVKAMDKLEILERLTEEDGNYVSVSDILMILGKDVKNGTD